MRIKLFVIGKTDSKPLKMLVDDYISRIRKFVKFEFIELPDVKVVKKMPVEVLKQKEVEILEKRLDCDEIILLDEHGKLLNSKGFAEEINKYMLKGSKCLGFVIGGAYGFTDELKNRYRNLALSKMTFSHQLVRLIFVEQLYRAFTILNSQPYHH